MEHHTFDIVIIGGGPGGLSAALVASRARRSVLVLDEGSPRNRTAHDAHGFISREGINPLELREIARAEVTGFGAEISTARVASVVREDGAFRIETDGGDTVTAGYVVVATGLRDELPAVPGLQENWGVEVILCPYCHGWEVKDRRLGVLANDVRSLHQVQLIRQWSSDVTLFTHDLAEPDVEDAARLNARGIRRVPGRVERVERREKGLVIVRDDGETEVDALFIAPRFVPNDEILLSLGAETEDTPMGRFVRTDGTGATTVPGLWAVGNVADPGSLIVHAASMGSKAASAINMQLVEADIERAVAGLR
ncbi:NAD(P)/FAD-dependent oxidoreductase [Glaciihabitans sp. UYNi722]|uniref:NAD(P)/FAD-dependent oxidoreductase n=1 Tax=Glaciihabitans sp. UYNi722 TaxID=3156344 RepID=UPI0033950272